jgi:hypothetical protein
MRITADYHNVSQGSGFPGSWFLVPGFAYENPEH